MIGNDVVDLQDPDARIESFRARFDERVYSDAEREAIATDAAPLARRWAHWGAKEAAYKLAKQVDAARIFTPRRLVANFEPGRAAFGSSSAEASRVRTGILELPDPLPNGVTTLELRSFEDEEHVHVVAVPLGSDWGAIDLGVQSIGSGQISGTSAATVVDPSVAVRSLARSEIARSLGVDAGRVSIGRQGRIPTVELDGRPTSLSLSLSHHGRWIAYAMRIHVELPDASVSEDEWAKSIHRNAWRASTG